MWQNQISETASDTGNKKVYCMFDLADLHSNLDIL